jgi:hypothetical protein
MDLREFHDRVYGKHAGRLFVFEPTWDAFRPIDLVGWNGSAFVVQDSKYKQDLFDKNYGYESLGQKALCRALIQDTELGGARRIEDPSVFWAWCGTGVKWWRDRPCVFHSDEVPRDNAAWRKYIGYLQDRPRTLRRPIHGRRATRRLVSK